MYYKILQFTSLLNDQTTKCYHFNNTLNIKLNENCFFTIMLPKSDMSVNVNQQQKIIVELMIY